MIKARFRSEKFTTFALCFIVVSRVLQRYCWFYSCGKTIVRVSLIQLIECVNKTSTKIVSSYLSEIFGTNRIFFTSYKYYILLLSLYVLYIIINQIILEVVSLFPVLSIFSLIYRLIKCQPWLIHSVNKCDWLIPLE